ncbi:MAG: hypothetical protein H7039_09665, partial [Bryobacteraceae bacterium]|nr:hypothetical protein [Bryobacteraceae bacterium]
ATFALGSQDKKFALAADVVCKNPEDAAVLRAQLEGITKMLASLIAREQKTPSAADLSGILTTGQFERVERRVRAKWTVEQAFLDSLAGS